tara:strand:- start:2972 stop:3127 length:156 start_codon:yes stop_codon:yes gene_type:complete
MFEYQNSDVFASYLEGKEANQMPLLLRITKLYRTGIKIMARFFACKKYTRI